MESNKSSRCHSHQRLLMLPRHWRGLARSKMIVFIIVTPLLFYCRIFNSVKFPFLSVLSSQTTMFISKHCQDAELTFSECCYSADGQWEGPIMGLKLLLVIESCDVMLSFSLLYSCQTENNSGYFLIHIPWLNLSTVLILHQKNYHSLFSFMHII